MSAAAQLVLRQDPAKVAPLDPAQPLTIGRARNNHLCLASWESVAPHHAVVRYSSEHGWLVCDWGSPLGTFCRGRPVRRCQPLRDGDAIALGPEGPELVFQLRAGSAPAPLSTPATLAAPPTPGAPLPTAPLTPADASPRSIPQGQSAAPSRPSPSAATPSARSEASATPMAAHSSRRRAPLQIAGREVPLATIRSAAVLSRPRHPHSFSWWVLACLGGLVFLPWSWLFWPWQIAALAAWILLGEIGRAHV